MFTQQWEVSEAEQAPHSAWELPENKDKVSSFPLCSEIQVGHFGPKGSEAKARSFS